MVIKKNFKAEVVERKKQENTKERKPFDPKKSAKRIAIFATVLVAAAGFFGFVFFAGNILQNWTEGFIKNKFISGLQEQQKIQEKPVVQTPTKPQEAIIGKTKEVISPPEKETPSPFSNVASPGVSSYDVFVPASFSDLFSGVGWLNQESTTMFHERVATAFTFSPKFKWERRYSSSFNEGQLITKKDDGSDERCIRGRCLLQRGRTLTLDGSNVSLPSEVVGKNIVHVSIGSLDTRWVVGVVVKTDKAYEGWVYSFDGDSFSKVFGEANTPFMSEYEGVFGFGGSDGDWIALYGGYQGIAYRIQSGRPFTNISNLFGYRMMGGGFHPAILRTESGWYIFSLTKEKPRLIKLFGDSRSGNISGIIDFAPSILIEGFQRASFKVLSDTKSSVVLGSLLETRGGSKEVWELTDDGFNMSVAREIISVNINNYPAEIRAATIMEAELYKGDATEEFFLSNDGATWIPVRIGEEISFPDKKGTRLFWGARFTPEKDATSSSYFDKIRIDYKVKFL